MIFFLANVTLQLLGLSTGLIQNRAILKKLELEDLFGDLSADRLSFSELRGGGPEGQGGVLLSFASLETLPVARMEPDRQSWRQISPAVWIATDRDPVSGAEQVPEPENLEREKPLVLCSTENVRMANGSIWEVPIIAWPVEDGQLLPPESTRCGLPTCVYRDVDGHWKANVLPMYDDLWRTSQKLFCALVQQGPVSYLEAFTFAIQVLSLRYRFNVLVHSRWPDQWLTTRNVMDVVRAAVGWNLVERLVEDQKKSLLNRQ